MGYYGKLEEKQTAQDLRRQGYSYNQIKEVTHLSKDTISRCCRDIVLSVDQINNLQNNQKIGQLKASIKGAKANKLKRIKRENDLIIEGVNQVGALSKRDRFIAGITFYQGEGSKTNHAVEFTNSDSETVRFMVRWFEDFCGIKPKSLKCSLWLHDNLDESTAKKYWSKLLRISLSQFGQTYFAKNKTDSHKIRKNIHNYGIIKIRYYDSAKLRLILGWIKGVLTN